MKHRTRVKQTKSLQDRLAAFAEEARQEAAGMPDGVEREKVLKAIKRAETASEIDALASPPIAPKQA